MVIKIYISGISGNKEVKKRQQRVLLILDSKNVKYEVIDIAEPGAEEAKDFMQNNSTALGGTISDPSPRHPLPPQIFNDDDYCGDYDLFDMANEIDEMEKFLKIETADSAQNISNAEIKLKNGEVTPNETDVVKEEEKETTEESEDKENEVSNEQEKLESEEKSKEEDEEDGKDKEGSADADTPENAKGIEEPTEDEEPKDKERKGSAASEGKEDTKDDDTTGAGDEDAEKEEGVSSKTDEEKAENE